jgi:hypothetical protein
VTEPDFEGALARSLHRRVRRIGPRPNLEALLARLEDRATRQRRLLLVGLVAVLVLGGIVGYAVGTDDARTETAIVALNDGVPDAPSGAPRIEPDDVDAAVAAITQAFHDGFNGGIPDATRRAAVQGGPELEGLRRDALASAALRGFTAEQLAGTTIEILGTTFVDRSHGIVHFTLTVPGIGPVLVDQVGYAVIDGGRWKVSLRTACDLLSLSGLGQQCPPRPS